MSRCGAEGPTGLPCRLPEDQPHLQHWDRTHWWENAEEVERQRTAPVVAKDTPRRRKGASQAQKRTQERLLDIRDRMVAQSPGRPLRRVWGRDEWIGYAIGQMQTFLESHPDPFTTAEHIWPLLVDPLPEVDRRNVRQVVDHFLKAGLIREVSTKRLRDTYHTKDGAEFQMNKIVPVYQRTT